MEKEMVSLHKAEFLSGRRIKMVRDLDSHFSNMRIEEDGGLGSNSNSSSIKNRLGAVEEKVLALDSDPSMIFCSSTGSASEYLAAVDEAIELRWILGESNANPELLARADSVLQTSMSRLQEEFTNLLLEHQHPMDDPGHFSFRSLDSSEADPDSLEDFSTTSFDSTTPNNEEFSIDLIHPAALPHLVCISETMFLSNYDKECAHAYTTVRREALHDSLETLRIEKLSIEEILQMDWSLLNSKIKAWNRGTKFFVRVILSSERRLSDLIFGDLSKELADSCFIGTTTMPLLQTLNFAQAVSMGSPTHVKLFKVLDMYECLAGLIPDLESLFPPTSSILAEIHRVLSTLAQFTTSILKEFETVIQANSSSIPFSRGGNHPVTSYVMNYLKTMTYYSDTINIILQENSDTKSSPIASLLLLVTSLLEYNLHNRSILYKDCSLRSIFMMNNLFYMVQKVKNSDLHRFLGDEWIREHTRMFQQYAVHYERSSWTSVLSFLKDDGVTNPGSSQPSKTVLKERFKNFNHAFEELYRTQTAWLVPAIPLRDDLRISISLRVLQAYRTFMGRYASYLDGVRHRNNYIKYYPDDLEKFLLDLFEGTPKSLSYLRKW